MKVCTISGVTTEGNPAYIDMDYSKNPTSSRKHWEIEPTYEVVNAKKKTDQMQLKEKNEYAEIKDLSTVPSETVTFPTDHDNTEIQQDTTSSSAKHITAWECELKTEANLCYGTAPSTPLGKHSVAGPALDKTVKTRHVETSLEEKNEYTEIDESTMILPNRKLAI